MDLASEKFVLFTTFRRDGRAVATPVWLADLGGGEFGFTTNSLTGKVKRLAHTARIQVQVCDIMGNVTPGAPIIEGTGRVVEGAELAVVRRAIIRKYGRIGVALANARARLMQLRAGTPSMVGNRGVIFTLTS